MKKNPLRPNLESLEDRRVMNVGPIGLLHQPAGSEAWMVGRADSSSELTINSKHAPGEFTAQVVADLNGDDVDDVLGLSEDNRWVLQVNDGTQLFAVDRGVAVSNLAEIIGTGDFDQNGTIDVLSRDTSNNLWVSNAVNERLVNRFWGTIPAAPDHQFIEDFDGDGDLDLLTASDGRWHLSRNEGTEFVTEEWGFLGDYGWQAIVSGDFNGDGKEDVAGLAGDRTWWLWESTDTVSEHAQYWGHWKMRDTWHDINAADFTNDGKDDLIGRTEDGRLWVGTATDTDFMTWTWDRGWVNHADWQHVTIIDVNDDGLPDQVGQANGKNWFYGINTGTAGFDNSRWQRQSTTGFVHLTKNFVAEEAVNVVASLPEGGINIQSNPIIVTLNDDNQLVLNGNGEELVGVEVKSESSSLIPIADNNAAPFQFLLLNQANNVSFGSLGQSVVLDEPLTLGVGWDPTSTADVTVAVGVGVEAVPAVLAEPLGDYVDREYSTAESNLLAYDSAN